MVTQPKPGLVPAPNEVVAGESVAQQNRCSPRQRFSAETRKRDDGDAVAHRRGALTPYRRKRSERRLESIMSSSGSAPPAPNPALLQEAGVVVLDELRLDLLHRVHCNAHDDQERRAAKIEVEAEALREKPRQDAVEPGADSGNALDLE